MNTHDDKMLHDAASRLLSGLRQGRGLDAQAAVDLKAELRSFAKAWEMSENIPKSSANLFVDLAGGIEACRYMYPGQQAEAIALLADEIGELVRICVAID